ncbi:MAG: alanine racemase, partial [Myxococcota bacterium]
LDLDAMDRNIDRVRDDLAGRDYRIVAKSLPGEALLSHVMARSGSSRLMVFHGRFAEAIARRHPRADLLFGKPMPAAVADAFLRAEHAEGFEAAKRVQWLIDSPERFRQYRELADAHRVSLRLNFEIDVGLHRGGFRDPAELARLVREIERAPRLGLGGLMGYDPHVAKLPEAFGLRAREFERVVDRYRAFRSVLPPGAPERVLNNAGSPTHRLRQDVDGVAGEVSVGSALVKPTDFDLDTLPEHEPALFIATPVLKASDGLVLPGLDGLGALHGLWDRNRRRTFFVYGGYWQARPVSPPGLDTNPVFGRSSNQEMLNGSQGVALDVDDFVFYRPTQSEFVMLQFGDVAIVRGGEIVDFWTPFGASA